MTMTNVPPLVPLLDADSRDTGGPGRTRAEIAAWEAVSDARTRTLDVQEGFAKMAEHAEPEFAPVVQAYLKLHTRHGEDLTRMLTDAGIRPDRDGSFMGSINRLVVATRALFDDIDADMLAQIRSGEERVLDAYETALSTDLPPVEREHMTRLLNELKTLLAETRPAT
jgi:uncharacterized protein (TIGR02284 family)